MPAVGSVSASPPIPFPWPAPAGGNAIKVDTAVVAAARKALSNAQAAVDTDKRHHSPDCVACDQKLVDKAQLQLAQAKSSPPPSATGTGSLLDVTV